MKSELSRHDEKIAELRYQGKTYNDIAWSLGLSLGNVYAHAKRLGLTKRLVHPSHQYDKPVTELREQGLSVRAVAEKLGVTQGVVVATMRRCGLQGKFSARPPRKPKPIKKRAQGGLQKERQPFTLMELGEQEGIRVLPTSLAQYERILDMLQRIGGEVI